MKTAPETKKSRFETGLPGIEVENRLRRAAETMDMSEAEVSFYLAEFDDMRLWKDMGYSSVIAYAEAEIGFSMKKTYALLNIGRRIRVLPVTRSAFEKGLIGWTKVRDICRYRGELDEEKMLERSVAFSGKQLAEFVTASNRALKRPHRNSLPSQSEELFPQDPEEHNPPEPGEPPFPNLDKDSSARSKEPFQPNSEVQCSPLPAVVRACSPARHVSVNLKLSPEDHAVLTEALRTWRRRNPGERKREEMVVSLARKFMEEENPASFCGPGHGIATVSEGIEKPGDGSGSVIGDRSHTTTSHGDEAGGSRTAEAPDQSREVPVLLDSPYNIYIHHCPECGKSTITGGSGEPVEVERSLLEKALCDGAFHIDDACVDRVEPDGSNHTGKELPAGGRNHTSKEKSVGEKSLTGKEKPAGERKHTGKGMPFDGRNQAGIEENRERKKLARRGSPGRKKRSVSTALRKKIFMRDGCVCRVPGCGRTSFLEIHHVRPLSRRGGNEPENLFLVCSRCHTNIHEGRIDVTGAYPGFGFRHIGRIGLLNKRLAGVGEQAAAGLLYFFVMIQLL